MLYYLPALIKLKSDFFYDFLIFPIFQVHQMNGNKEITAFDKLRV
jgi:hypothetical protein